MVVVGRIDQRCCLPSDYDVRDVGCDDDNATCPVIRPLPQIISSSLSLSSTETAPFAMPFCLPDATFAGSPMEFIPFAADTSRNLGVTPLTIAGQPLD